jgi:hypothetical protein
MATTASNRTERRVTGSEYSNVAAPDHSPGDRALDAGVDASNATGLIVVVVGASEDTTEVSARTLDMLTVPCHGPHCAGAL